jgi:hypothetical protein
VNLNSRLFIIGVIVWSAVVTISLCWNLDKLRNITLSNAASEAKARVEEDKSLRHWATSHGGVYVEVDERTPPNEHLSHIDERDITTPSGRRLTLMNPAYMLRQIHEDFDKIRSAKGHITSLKPLRLQNTPDQWERNALLRFEKGEEQVAATSSVNGVPHFRLMRPIVTKRGCLKCHEKQGYKVGDIIGGVSTSIPLTEYTAEENESSHFLMMAHLITWICGVIAIVLFALKIAANNEIDNRKSIEVNLRHEVARRRIAEEEKQKTIIDLQKAIKEIQTLEGILPICSHCKKIKDDKGYWEVLETYVSKRTEALFSHGICPECLERHYGDIL